MKKFKKLKNIGVLAIIFVLLIISGVYAYRAGEAPAKQAQTAANRFLHCVKIGNFDRAKRYCTEEAYSRTKLAEFDSIEENMLSSIGFKKKDLGDKGKKSLAELTRTLKDNFLDSYTITSIEETETGFIVRAKIKYGYDVNKLAKIKVSSKESKKIVDSYVKKNRDELLKIEENKGTEAVQKKIIRGTMADYVNKYLEKLDKLEPVEGVVQLSIERKSGDFKVTDTAMIIQE